MSKKGWAPGVAYTAADGGPFVGTIDLTSGIITPVVTGLANPGGLMFVDTSKRDDGFSQEQNEESCRNDRQ